MSSLSKSSSAASSSGDEEAVELRRGPWTLEEDTLLIRYIACHGEGRWNLLAKSSGLRRTGKSCRLRWLNYLKPDVKRGNLTPEEQLLILQLHTKWGNRWSKIAQYLPGRTDNEIKNYWRTRVQKQARQLRIDCNSTEFQEIITHFWIPRLLQKIQGSSFPSTMQFENLTATNRQVSHTSHDRSESDKNSCPDDRLILTEDSILLESHVMSSQHVWQNSTNSTVRSTESMDIMLDTPQISEYPTSPFRGMGNINEEYHNTFLDGFYKVDNISNYDNESFSISTMEAPGAFGNSIGVNCHASESNWIDNELPESLWSMDEKW